MLKKISNKCAKFKVFKYKLSMETMSANAFNIRSFVRRKSTVIDTKSGNDRTHENENQK